MSNLIGRLPLLMELLLNGSFIVFYSLKRSDKIPQILNPEFIDLFVTVGAWLAPMVLFFSVSMNFLSSRSIEDFLRRHVFSLIIFIPLVITWGDVEFAFRLSAAHLLASVLSLYDLNFTQESKVAIKKKNIKVLSFFTNIKLRPAQVVFLSFFALIMFGTFLLMVPISSATTQSISFIDALFMSTSAACVTGLATISVNDNLSAFGQVVLLGLVQVGGLGIMTLSSSMTILLGKAMGMRDQVMLQDVLDVSNMEDLLAIVIDIIKYTFFIELWGAIVLAFAFVFEGFDLSTSIYYGFFHSISAFCNAGFSIFNTNMESYAVNPLVHFTISILITLGGLGFVVLKELKAIMTLKKHISNITVHSRVVLVTSFLLTLLGTLFIFFGEFLHALDSYSLWEKIQISIFQSVTLRTAGFNTIPLGNLHAYTLYGMTLFMFIGASPGSTGGGIKTSTLAILIQSIIATLKGKKTVVIYDRTISPQTIVKATALTFISLAITCIFVLILMKVESEQSFLTILFEAISAMNTVGLSLGVTPYLTFTGKFLISLLMFIGRIGPLTLVLAVGEKIRSTGKVEYPDGKIMIG